MVEPVEEKHTYPPIEELKTDLRRVQQEGKLRTERIREIVRDAILKATEEVKQGSSEIRPLVKATFAAVVESLQGRSKEIQEDVTASVQGMIEGISQSKRQAIAQSQTELNQLQTQIEQQEKQLNAEVENTLAEIDSASQSSSADMQNAIASAITVLQDSEEAALLRKRYAQLQAQLSILKANLAARYGEHYDEMQEHLDQAKTWYRDALQDQADHSKSSHIDRKQAEFEQKLGEAGAAIARREKQVKQILRDLLHNLVEQIENDKKSR
jgi:predicted component of type VI protein secretion system